MAKNTTTPTTTAAQNRLISELFQEREKLIMGRLKKGVLAAMKERGYSINQLEYLSKLPKNHLVDWLVKKKRDGSDKKGTIPIAALVALAECLKINEQWIINGGGVRKKPL